MAEEKSEQCDRGYRRTHRSKLRTHGAKESAKHNARSRLFQSDHNDRPLRTSTAVVSLDKRPGAVRSAPRPFHNDSRWDDPAWYVKCFIDHLQVDDNDSRPKSPECRTSDSTDGTATPIRPISRGYASPSAIPQKRQDFDRSRRGLSAVAAMRPQSDPLWDSSKRSLESENDTHTCSPFGNVVGRGGMPRQRPFTDGALNCLSQLLPSSSLVLPPLTTSPKHTNAKCNDDDPYMSLAAIPRAKLISKLPALPLGQAAHSTAPNRKEKHRQTSGNASRSSPPLTLYNTCERGQSLSPLNKTIGRTPGKPATASVAITEQATQTTDFSSSDCIVKLLLLGNQCGGEEAARETRDGSPDSPLRQHQFTSDSLVAESESGSWSAGSNLASPPKGGAKKRVTWSKSLPRRSGYASCCFHPSEFADVSPRKANGRRPTIEPRFTMRRQAICLQNDPALGLAKLAMFNLKTTSSSKSRTSISISNFLTANPH